MSFQLKNFTSIVLGEINHARVVTDRVNDFAPGSVVRTIMEAPAVEIEELYLQMFLGLRDAIPVSAYVSFGFDKSPAVRAFGYVSISSLFALEQDEVIEFGTLFETADGLQYTADADVIWRAGQSLVQVPVRAVLPGLAGNVPAGAITITQRFPAVSGFAVSNQAITNGVDEESDESREGRFAEFIRSLSRGTVAACRYAASLARISDAGGITTEHVTRIGLHEVPGRVSIYIYSNQGVPSAALIADGQRRLDGYRDENTGAIIPGVRSAGVQVDVLPMVERAVAVAIAVRMRFGYSLTPAVIQSLTDTYATAIRAVPAGGVLYLGDLTETLLKTPGVSEIVPQTTSNIFCDVTEALVPGVLTVTSF